MSSDSQTQIQLLLNQAAAGDTQAYEQVLQHASHRLQLLTSRMLKNYPRVRRWEETGDVFQTAAMRLHRSLKDVGPSTAKEFFGLAATQIRRTLIDLARHHYGPLGQATRHHSDVGITDVPQLVEIQQAPSEEPETLESWADFHESVEQLPENERAVFELVWYSGLPQAEIAELLEVSIPTIKRRLRSARLILAESIRFKRESNDDPRKQD